MNLHNICMLRKSQHLYFEIISDLFLFNKIKLWDVKFNLRDD